MYAETLISYELLNHNQMLSLHITTILGEDAQLVIRVKFITHLKKTFGSLTIMAGTVSLCYLRASDEKEVNKLNELYDTLMIKM